MGFPPSGFQQATITKKTHLSDEVLGLWCQFETVVPFAAGQWVDLVVPGINRAGGYSMTSTPQAMVQGRGMGLAIRRGRHPVTVYLHEQLKVGDQVGLRVGGDCLWQEAMPRPLLLIAGGIGINPMWSIFQTAAACDPSRPITLCYSSKDPTTTVFAREICDLVKAGPNRRVFFFFTGSRHPIPKTYEDITTASPIHHTFGRPTPEAIVQIVEKPGEVTAFMCGPPAMIDGLAPALKTLGLQDLRYEKWW